MADNSEHTSEPVTSEEIAAFLDGRLTGADRDEVAGRIATDDGAYAAFSEAAHYMQSEVAESLSGDEPAPADSVNWWPLAIAAAVLAAVAVWIGLPSGADTSGLAGELVANLNIANDAVAGYLYPDDPNLFGFSGARPEVISFGLGVARLDLELSRVSGEGTERATASLFARSAPIAGAGGVVDEAVQAVLEEPTDDAVRRMDDAISSELDAFHYRFGQWAEASRIAAASGSVAYFDAASYRNFLAETDEQTLNPEVADILGRIRDASSGSVSPETLEPLFDQLILEF